MHAQRNGIPMLASSGYVSQVDEDLCIGCGDCVEYCQFGALEVVDGLNRVDYEKCMGCGVCADVCPSDWIALRRDPAKGEPLDLAALIK
jgi:heterodisulfide reductase subunit A-like polyferredoxin